MSKRILLVFSVLLIVTMLITSCKPAAPKELEATVIQLWTKEGEADGGLQFVQSLADAFTAANPSVTFEITNKEVETLREDFQTASLAGDPPSLLWTVNDHAGPFSAAGLIMPATDLVADTSIYVESALAAGKLGDTYWGVPISNGNHLMLLYNKDLVPTPPANTDELLSIGASITSGDVYGLVFNQTEPFFIVPWLGGFGGKVFADDGITPTLDTQAMIDTMAFVYSLKSGDSPISPESCDYDTADTLFKEGKAGMIINGDWSLGGYQEALGDKLGVAPIPMVSSTSLWPAPYTSGVMFMAPAGLEGAELEAVKAFIAFVTADKTNQLRLVSDLKRLPALKSAIDDPSITGDPLLAGSAKQMTYGTPMPANLEMRCVWDSWKPEMQAVLNGTKDAATGAADAQAAAVICVAALE
jgi:arabinogalactan oligomer / maltooligosaccharide transport system substrate-binding protein